MGPSAGRPRGPKIEVQPTEEPRAPRARATGAVRGGGRVRAVAAARPGLRPRGRGGAFERKAGSREGRAPLRRVRDEREAPPRRPSPGTRFTQIRAYARIQQQRRHFNH